MTADLRQAPDLLGDLLGDLPVDPLAQAWEDILAAVLAEGPPEDLEGRPDTPGRVSDPVAESLRVLRVAGAEVPVGDLDGPAVAVALAAVDLTSAAVSDAEVVAAAAAASRLAGWAAGREVAATAELTARAGRLARGRPAGRGARGGRGGRVADRAGPGRPGAGGRVGRVGAGGG